MRRILCLKLSLDIIIIKVIDKVKAVSNKWLSIEVKMNYVSFGDCSIMSTTTTDHINDIIIYFYIKKKKEDRGKSIPSTFPFFHCNIANDPLVIIPIFCQWKYILPWRCSQLTFCNHHVCNAGSDDFVVFIWETNTQLFTVPVKWHSSLLKFQQDFFVFSCYLLNKAFHSFCFLRQFWLLIN